MKRKWIAVAALVGVEGAAHAQSSVTLYGALDTGLLYSSTSAASFSPKALNTGKVYAFKDGGVYSSIWGLKGTEDIGDGYKVHFKLQGSFNSGTGKLGLADAPGASAVFNQQTTVGVSGPFGTFDMGRQIAPVIYSMYDTDVRGAQYFGSILTAWLGLNQAAGWPGTSTNGPIGALWDDNALVYQVHRSSTARPSRWSMRPAASPGQFQGGTRESVVLKYSDYGLNLAAAYYNGHDTNLSNTTVPTGLDNNRFYYLGAKYTFTIFPCRRHTASARTPLTVLRLTTRWFRRVWATGSPRASG